MPSSAPIRLVSNQEIRDRFNRGRYAQRLAQGEFTAVEGRKDRHLAKTVRDMPPCTLSQVVSYLTAKGGLVAVVHQYLLPNGRLGASGLPDPKYLFEAGTIYRVVPEDR